MKKALILYYSQAGQTEKAIEVFSRGLGKGVAYDAFRIEPTENFVFPWAMRNFFRAFPRCVRGPAPEIKPLAVDWDQYDLVILGYQVWFLSPSLPFQGFLQSACAAGLRGKKVITLVTCRNLWQSAALRVRARLLELGAEVAGQITLCELSPLWASFVTTPRWFLTGKKDAFWFFPPAGISPDEFAKLETKGESIGRSWAASQLVDKTQLGSNLNRVSLRLMDRIGIRFFRVWATLIQTLAPTPGIPQDLLLVLFRANLVALIFFVGPCTKIVEALVHNDPNWSVRPSDGLA